MVQSLVCKKSLCLRTGNLFDKNVLHNSIGLKNARRHVSMATYTCIKRQRKLAFKCTANPNAVIRMSINDLIRHVCCLE